MHHKISTAPKGFRTATPVLTVAGAASAVDFYAHVFGAEESNRVYGVDGLSVAHSELKIGNSMLILCDENLALGIHAPTTLGATPVSVHLYLDDVDAVWERAIEAGATVLVPLEDVYWGERYGKLADPYGHVWSVAKRIEDLSAEEIASRAVDLSAPVILETVAGLDASEDSLGGIIESVPVEDVATEAA